MCGEVWNIRAESAFGLKTGGGAREGEASAQVEERVNQN